MNPARILLVHLVANGDCLMVTTIARQIKKDFPGCHLTWAISYKCRQVIDNNPDVDEVWEVRYGPGESPVGDVWRRVRGEAEQRRARGEFDFVFYTQIYPDNISMFDGTTRSSTFGCYPRPITVPVSPVVCLREEEIARARVFASENRLQDFRSVVLFECAPGSGQSVLDQAKGIAVAERIVAAHEDAAVIVSTHIPFVSPHPRVLDGSRLSFRENAALSHYCTLLVGCSSGITWLLTSDAAKKLPTVQFLNGRAMASGFASVAYDFAYFGLPSSHILECDADGVETMSAVVSQAMTDFDAARSRCHRLFKPAFWDFLCFFDYHSVRGATRIFATFARFVRRNHFSLREMMRFGSLFRIVKYAGDGAVRYLTRGTRG